MVFPDNGSGQSKGKASGSHGEIAEPHTPCADLGREGRQRGTVGCYRCSGHPSIPADCIPSSAGAVRYLSSSGRILYSRYPETGADSGGGTDLPCR